MPGHYNFDPDDTGIPLRVFFKTDEEYNKFITKDNMIKASKDEWFHIKKWRKQRQNLIKEKRLKMNETNPKKENETWLEWLLGIAEEYKLQKEVEKSYIKYTREGYDEEHSACMALYDWDL